MAKHITICAGIDTGKRKLDVAIEGRREQLQVENTSEGHKVLLAWLRQHRVKRVGIEASGGYEQPVVAELRRKRFVVVVFQPAQVRAYAKFHLQRAKNDKIDAALIAACTAAVRKIHAAPDPRLLPFAEQLTMIDQISEDIARLKNRIESCRNAQINKLWQEDIARLEQREKAALKTSGRLDPQASRPCQETCADQQRRWHRTADRRCHPGASARDRSDHPGASCRSRRPCAL